MLAEVGMELPPFEVAEVSVEKMKTMAALLRDPNPLHWDVESVRATGLGDRVINQGPNNMAYILNLLIEWTGDARRVRSLKARFLDSAFAGDHLRAGGVVTGVRRDGKQQIAECEVWLERVGGGRLMAGTATVVLDDGPQC